MFPPNPKDVIQYCSIARDLVYLGITRDTIQQEMNFLFDLTRTTPCKSVAKPMQGGISLCRNLFGHRGSNRIKCLPTDNVLFESVYSVLRGEMDDEFAATSNLATITFEEANVTDSIPLRDANDVSRNGAAFHDDDYYCQECSNPLGNAYFQCIDCSNAYQKFLTQNHYNLCHGCHKKASEEKLLSELHSLNCGGRSPDTNTMNKRCSNCSTPACGGSDCEGACLDHCKKQCHYQFKLRYRFFLPNDWKDFASKVDLVLTKSS
jgi:hypothetical protein